MGRRLQRRRTPPTALHFVLEYGEERTEYGVQSTEYRVQIIEYRVQIIEYRVQIIDKVKGERGVPVSTFHLSVCNIPPPLRSSQRRNGDNLGGHGMPCPYKLMLSSVLCYLLSVLHPLSPPETGGIPRSGEGVCVSFTFRFPLSVFPFPFTSYPLPLRVLPLSQGEKASGHLKRETRTSPTSHPPRPSVICIPSTFSP